MDMAPAKRHAKTSTVLKEKTCTKHASRGLNPSCVRGRSEGGNEPKNECVLGFCGWIDDVGVSGWHFFDWNGSLVCSYLVNDESGAMELVKPSLCKPLQYASAWAFHVVVTVATPAVCAVMVMRWAFFRETVRTTLTMAPVTYSKVCTSSLWSRTRQDCSNSVCDFLFVFFFVSGLVMTATPPPLSEPNSGPRLPMPGRGLEISAIANGGGILEHVAGEFERGGRNGTDQGAAKAGREKLGTDGEALGCSSNMRDGEMMEERRR